jgi:hypothetical protein
MYIFKSFCLLLMAGILSPVLAEEHRQHGAHEHGVGILNIAQEGVELHIELDTPAVNIVGFEHVPNNEEEHEALENALERLRDGAALFVFPEEADCRLLSADAKTPLADHEGGEAHPVDTHDDEQHEAHHEEDEHHDGHDHEAAHADIDAAWYFTCEHSDRLDRIGVRLFDVFPRTQRLQVQYITEKQQGAASLNAAQPELRF